MSIYAGRKFLVLATFVFVYLVFLLRLFYIQLIDDSYKLSAQKNVLRLITDYPARGYIYDRHGKLLVFNEAAYDLMVVPNQVKNIDTADFCKLLKITKDEFISRIQKARKYSAQRESVFEKLITSDTYAAFQEKLYKFTGFYTQPRIIRKYPSKVAAHLLGYIGEASESVIEKNSYYRSGDYIGISGIESTYETALRGKRGTRIMLVDVFNKEKGSFENGRYDTAAIPGYSLTSTIDLALQKYGEELMVNKRGSIVAIEPSTGEVLAIVTSPTYDPNLLIGHERSANYVKLLQDTAKPLFNRALMAVYPPGSTFKLVNGLIGLNDGVITTNTRFSCTKGFHFGGVTIGCHAHASPLNFFESIQQSCNAYYCNVFKSIIENPRIHSSRLGYISWRKSIASFGLGKRLGTDIANELSGFVPTAEYYDKHYGKNRWNAYTMISVGIGQGEVGATPLQLANVVATIANRGFYYVPHIIKMIGDSVNANSTFTTRMYTSVKSTYFAYVVDGMRMVVESGTARGSKIDSIPMCGKTGTAQNPHGKDHSLFVAFAPIVNPKIAIAVVIENAGFGAEWAAPIASLMIEKYIRGHTNRPEVEEKMLNTNLINPSENARDQSHPKH